MIIQSVTFIILKVNVEYQNLKTNEYFFMVKDKERFRIYELKIVLL